LDEPELPPELYNEDKVAEEKLIIANAIKKNVEGERPEDKLKKEHYNKYERFWE
jgi:hypothetical protein